ncbi:MAG: ATP-NAD kinase family protein [Pseudomonadales bacterium]|nr:ATP-NAD kinase family protein [Pseudomonadales bacterium]
MRIGLLVNPMAGIGGAAAFKGSDGEAAENAKQLGYRSPSAVRCARVLALLAPIYDSIEMITCAGTMGADFCRGLALKMSVVYPIETASHDSDRETTAEDTLQAVKAMLPLKPDLFVFVGGDGTARDVCSIMDENQLVLGVPAGVKMHSGVFALSPEAAARVIQLLVQSELVAVRLADVRDIDEEALRKGQVNSRRYGQMLIPDDIRYLQHVKCGGVESEELVCLDIAAFLDEICEPDVYYIVGAGTTTHAVKTQLAGEGTLLGVDVIKNHECVARDVNEKQLFELISGQPCKIILTPTGGQGCILGRGNQQLSPRVIREVGASNLVLVATKAKLQALDGRPLFVDTGDNVLDRTLSGLHSILTGYDDYVAYAIHSPH